MTQLIILTSDCFIDNSMTLLHFIVRTYINECKEPMKETLPVPEPSDVDRAAHVTFDDLQQGLKELKIKLAGEYFNIGMC